MNDFFLPFGWWLLLVAAVFALGLWPRVGRHFYPGAPGFRRRLAAPVIFTCLAVACFRGAGLQAMLVTVILGMTQIVVSRGNRPQRRPRT
jgi:hypothetical protein